jgi:hypothetical protein
MAGMIATITNEPDQPDQWGYASRFYFGLGTNPTKKTRMSKTPKILKSRDLDLN